MLVRIIENKEAVNLLSASHENLPVFTANEWTILSNLTKILQPIYRATIFLQKRSTSVGSIIPLMKALEHDLVLEPVCTDFPRVRTAIVNGIKTRMNGRPIILIKIPQFLLLKLGR